MSKLKVGDVLRATRVYYNADRDDGKIPNKYLPIYGQVTELHEEHPYIRLVPPYPDTDKKHYDPRRQCLDENDVYEIVPLDEWPDHVCVELAKRALTEGDER